jgi:lipopolysaccharide export system protein LptA
MKTLRLFLLLPLGWVVSAHGQGASRLTTPSSGSDSKKQLQQAAERLREAQKSGELDRAKDKAKDLLKNLPPGVTDAAKAALQTPEARAQAIEAAKAAAGSALPQAQSMINGQTQPPATIPPATIPVPTAAPAVQDQPPPAPSGPMPGALAPLGTASATAKGTPTGIIEADKVFFDNNTSIIIYTGHVRARHPDFYIECEELELHMIKEEPDDAKKGAATKTAPKAADPISAKGGKKADKAPPIKKAIARGPMVIIEKRDINGDVQQGRCKRLEYDGATGNMTLSDFPQVQKGNILHIATTADTVMVFDREGRLSTNRPSRTVILSDDTPQQRTTPPSN